MSAPLAIGGSPVNFTQAANPVVSAVPGILLGILVNSTTGGTIKIDDSATAVDQGAKTGVITPAVGWFDCEMEMVNGCFLVLGGTINATAMFATYGQPYKTPTSPPQA